jgi:hypothetical protein
LRHTRPMVEANRIGCLAAVTGEHSVWCRRLLPPQVSASRAFATAPGQQCALRWLPQGFQVAASGGQKSRSSADNSTPKNPGGGGAGWDNHFPGRWRLRVDNGVWVGPRSNAQGHGYEHVYGPGRIGKDAEIHYHKEISRPLLSNVWEWDTGSKRTQVHKYKWAIQVAGIGSLLF